MCIRDRKYSDQEQDRLYIQRTEIKYKDQNGKTVYAVRDFPKSESSMDGIELSNSAITVSYTHLDVYKRQSMEYEQQAFEFN